MLTIPKINKEQIERFKKDGFLIIKNGFNQKETDMIESWATELANMPEKSGTHWVYHEKE